MSRWLKCCETILLCNLNCIRRPRRELGTLWWVGVEPCRPQSGGAGDQERLPALAVVDLGLSWILGTLAASSKAHDRLTVLDTSSRTVCEAISPGNFVMGGLAYVDHVDGRHIIRARWRGRSQRLATAALGRPSTFYVTPASARP